jgi:crossover junction endodeoxyribonuclease RuvC
MRKPNERRKHFGAKNLDYHNRRARHRGGQVQIKPQVLGNRRLRDDRTFLLHPKCLPEKKSTSNLFQGFGFDFRHQTKIGILKFVGITPQQFNQMQQRLNQPSRVVAPVLEPAAPGNLRAHATILGLDPSLRGTGFGIIRMNKPVPQTLIHGTISCPAGWERSRCLVKISQTLRDVLKRYQPEICVVEGLFYAQNLQTALIMGEARGAALATIAEAGLEIYELAPRKVKQAIVGYGAAQKLAVAKMVQRLLRLAEQPEPDAADALALALAHAQEQGRYSLTAPKRV